MITEDGDLSHESKRGLLLGRKARTNQDSTLKIRDIPLPPKVRPVIAMVFPVVMYGCESWTIKKAEGRSFEKKSQSKGTGFGLWSWRRLLRVPRMAKGSNQCTLKEISREYSLEEVMLTLTLQYFDHLMQRTD